MSKKGDKLGKYWSMHETYEFCTSVFSIFLKIVMSLGFAYLGFHKAACHFLAAIKMAPKWTVFPIFQKNHVFSPKQMQQ